MSVPFVLSDSRIGNIVDKKDDWIGTIPWHTSGATWVDLLLAMVSKHDLLCSNLIL